VRDIQRLERFEAADVLGALVGDFGERNIEGLQRIPGRDAFQAVKEAPASVTLSSRRSGFSPAAWPSLKATPDADMK
jgi:hypothetical protein